MPSIALDRFTSTLPDLLKCPACKNAAYPPYLLCASEHVRCSACAFTLYATDTCPDRGCAAAPLKLNVRRSPMLNRAFEAYKVKCRNPGCAWTGPAQNDEAHEAGCAFRQSPCSHCRRLYKTTDLEAHYKTCPEGGRTMAGGRGVMPTHIDEECAQWTCRAVEGCETRTTRANLAKHEEGCSTDHENIKAFAREILRLRNAVDASTERCNALEEEKSDLTAKLAEEEKRRASMVTSSTSTDPVESSAATDKQSASINKGVLTSSSCANVDPAGQATKRSSRIAAKRRSSQAFADASDARPSPSRRNSVKPEPADA
ncbi:ubiquitin-protein ligase [Rhodotorula toruloides NP11]|uniref:Ubiquitin-protein ligase n=1 Tax=Rhodotorula toruloides (strain NP11) TaxID=1130832 RepID=M7X024_RHOT1|nr:ubiquitin-protein ligase [Rhodotorula toruloides NP11]EMS23455.1 ubiquitin-protein ligase [Rhodotorula toruloides NP11]